ncbi:hypothetical protein [Sphingopyxis macrogoltabida]|uniref:DUF262 domain-containing protein n=1 Tax=Sphingopyxis macrogoltabida TaxID=33050 RepID=A0A0N7GSK5_SPHMC|nr:hypothetical protein [Sphingopyxis macrogoltabida]ALH80971.1 hypothetical protein AN936_11505 [Sphingopyxis macrogoltabida]
MSEMNWLHDKRTECYSVQTTMSVGDYIDLIKTAHSARGALSGQRDTLKTTTAKRIRDRMVGDLRRGAILPPVVIGAVVDEAKFAEYPITKAKTPTDILPDEVRKDLSIIDGMQRTSALLEAVEIDSAVRNNQMRVEFWLTKNVRTMVYRMLVLNTGQVPWTLARQLSVVFAPLLNEVQDKVPEINRMFTPDKPGRRVNPGEFSSDALVELYLAFSLRKTNVDTKEALSDEFSRLDFVENLSDKSFQEYFYTTLSVLTKLDVSFSRYDNGTNAKFSKGRNIFDSQPARIGFTVATAQHVLGRPGMDRESTDRESRMAQLEKNALALLSKLETMNAEELGDFLKLDVLAETLDRRVGQVGRYERGVYFEGFQVLISENFELRNMEPCWRAN